MLVFHGLLSIFLLLVCYTDLTRYTIPNWVVGVILALYPVMALTMPGPIPWIEAVAVMLITFFVCFSLFNAGAMGGGDTKLITACALWTGKEALIPFIVWTSLYGGALTLIVLAIRFVMRRNSPRYRRAQGRTPNPRGTRRPVHRLFVRRGKVPYGVAIALGFLTALWSGLIPGMPVPWMPPLEVK